MVVGDCRSFHSLDLKWQVSVCFNVDDQLDQLYEVVDIDELHIGDTSGAALTEAIIVGAETVGNGYTHKFCGWTTPTMRTCVADFLLSAAFFDYSALTLAGYGAVRLEWGGDNPGRQRRLKFEIGSREMKEGETGVAGFKVEPREVQMQGPKQPPGARSSAAVRVWSHTVLWVGLVSFMGCFV